MFIIRPKIIRFANSIDFAPLLTSLLIHYVLSLSYSYVDFQIINYEKAVITNSLILISRGLCRYSLHEFTIVSCKWEHFSNLTTSGIKNDDGFIEAL